MYKQAKLHFLSFKLHVFLMRGKLEAARASDIYGFLFARVTIFEITKENILEHDVMGLYHSFRNSEWAAITIITPTTEGLPL